MLPLQREDFKNIFRSCNGRQVISHSILSCSPLLSSLLLCLWDAQDNEREKKIEESVINNEIDGSVNAVISVDLSNISQTQTLRERRSRDAVLVSR